MLADNPGRACQNKLHSSLCLGPNRRDAVTVGKRNVSVVLFLRNLTKTDSRPVETHLFALKKYVCPVIV